MSRFGPDGSRGGDWGRSDWVDEIDLTATHLELLRLLARGNSVAGVAEKMAFSVGYTYERLRDLRDTIGAATNTAAVVEGLRLGVIEIPKQEDMAEW